MTDGLLYGMDDDTYHAHPADARASAGRMNSIPSGITFEVVHTDDTTNHPKEV